MVHHLSHIYSPAIYDGVRASLPSSALSSSRRIASACAVLLYLSSSAVQGLLLLKSFTERPMCRSFRYLCALWVLVGRSHRPACSGLPRPGPTAPSPQHAGEDTLLSDLVVTSASGVKHANSIMHCRSKFLRVIPLDLTLSDS